MTTQTMNYPLHLELPWESSSDDQRRFYASLGTALGVAILLMCILPFIDIPEISRDREEVIPPRLAKLIIEKRKIELPPKPEPIIPEVKEPEIKEPEKKEEPPKVEKKPKEVKPEPVKTPVKKTSAKAVAKRHARVFDALDSIREPEPITNATASPQLVRAGEQQTTQRDILTNATKKTSGGVKAGPASTNAPGGRAIGTSDVTKVQSGITASAAKPAKSKSKGGTGATRQRSSESIARVFDRNKSSIYQVYHRALRKNPTLKGRVVFHLTISPTGKVTKVRIVSSELNDKKLEKKLKFKIKRINFGAEEVATWSNTYHIDFLPS